MPNYSTQIAELEEILQAGASKVSVDGKTVEYDLMQVRQRLAYLRSQDTCSVATGLARPVVSKIKLSGF